MTRAALAAIGMLALSAQGAVADQGPAALMTFMGAHGCTFAPDSRAAARGAGFAQASVDAVIAAALADGTASRQGDYVVLHEASCTIRLPDITRSWTVTSPEIVALTSPRDAYAAEGWTGCYLGEVFAMLDTLNGGQRGAGWDDYIRFVAAGIIAGDVRFYGPSLLATPPSMMVMAGDCADVPNREAIDRSHTVLAKGFGDYVRLKGSEEVCNGGKPVGDTYLSFPFRQQGIDETLEIDAQPEINAWLYFEYDLITYAAGWYEGMSGTARGTPRPPMCHYR